MRSKKNLIALWLGGTLLVMLLTACSSTTTPAASNEVAAASATASTSSISTPTNAGTTATTASTSVTVADTIASATSTTQPATSAVTTAVPATPTTSAPTPATTPIIPAQPTPTANTTQANFPNVVYSKAEGLFAYNLATGKSFELAAGHILRYIISPDKQRVAFLVVNGDHLELKMVTIHADAASEPHTLDAKVAPYVAATQDDPYSGRYLLALSLDFSPDSTLVAYSKMNDSGPMFDFWGSPVKPVEIWLGEAQSYQVHRLVANSEKDFMYKVTFSPDGERVGFIRTATFPTDVSGTSALWSVHTDGTKLSLLQDGAVLSHLANPAAPSNDEVVGLINNFDWTGPLGVTFYVMDIQGGSVWTHDLGTAKASKLFSLNYSKSENQSYKYDPVSRRYAFANEQGLFTIGTTSSQEKPVQITNQKTQLLNFYSKSVVYLSETNKVTVQTVNDKGGPNGGALTIATKFTANDAALDAWPANNSWVISWLSGSQLNVGVFSADGKAALGPVINGVETDGLTRVSPALFLVQTSSGLQLLDLSNGGTFQLKKL